MISWRTRPGWPSSYSTQPTSSTMDPWHSICADPPETGTQGAEQDADCQDPANCGYVDLLRARRSSAVLLQRQTLEMPGAQQRQVRRRPVSQNLPGPHRVGVCARHAAAAGLSRLRRLWRNGGGRAVASALEAAPRGRRDGRLAHLLKDSSRPGVRGGRDRRCSPVVENTGVEESAHSSSDDGDDEVPAKRPNAADDFEFLEGDVFKPASQN
ncbi:hypothetical protein HPB52_024641 [Rhipicephalus sanguineus]|uniref:Uncharacterized protein n=1 Tax=Rhipicephalus sanguineus TaxID=34632 RepID=A0A9D4TE22_RHISA|nr:hypothetical protein HPB52_024641 [Rhipicephalus sanguineus]